MADVDAIHYVVEHIDELSHHRGEGQSEQELSDGGGAQKGFLVFHVFPFFACLDTYYNRSILTHFEEKCKGKVFRGQKRGGFFMGK
jgi:hypothetical protein